MIIYELFFRHILGAGSFVNWILICGSIILCYHFLTRKTKNYPPGPWGLPVVGHLPRLGEKPHFPIEKWCRKYGDVMQLYFGSRRVVVISDYRTLKTCLLDQWNDFGSRPNFIGLQLASKGRAIVGKSTTKAWKLQRKCMRTALNSVIRGAQDVSSAFEEHVTRTARQFTAELINKSRAETPYDNKMVAEKRGNLIFRNAAAEFDPREHVFDHVIRMLFTLCFGDRERNLDNLEDFKLALKRIIKYFNSGLAQDIFPWITKIYTPELSEFKADLNASEEIVLQERELYLKSGAHESKETKEIMKTLVQTGKSIKSDDKLNTVLSEEDVQMLCVDFINAGLFTTNGWISWFLYLMARNKNVQDRAHSEVRSILGVDLPVLATDRKRLPFTEAAIWETFRYATALPLLIPHTASKDTKINGYDIPEGTLLFVNAWGLSRDKRLWHEPDQFRPERFLKYLNSDNDSGKSLDTDQQSFQNSRNSNLEYEKIELDVEKVDQMVAFGLGSRRCIGEPLGRMQVFVIAATIIQRCELFLATDFSDAEEKCFLGGDMPPFKICVKARQA